MRSTTDPPDQITGDSDEAATLRSWSDPAAFTVVFHRHHADVHRYLSRRVGSTLADELASEVFTTAFAIRRKWDPDKGGVRPWLYGIAHNVLRGHLRTERRKLLAYARHGVDPVVDADSQHALDGVESRVDAEDRRRRVARALAGLRRAERDLLLLVTWSGLSYEEAATALSLPIGTVRSRLHRARTKLRDALSDPSSTVSHKPYLKEYPL